MSDKLKLIAAAFNCQSAGKRNKNRIFNFGDVISKKYFDKFEIVAFLYGYFSHK